MIWTKELEKRGLPFVRYADDLVIFMKSEAAAQRVYASVERYLTLKLKLIVNHDKSSIRKTDGLEYVGYEFGGYGGQIRVSSKKVAAFKQRVSEIFRRNRGRSMKSRFAEFRSYATGWLGYFALDQVKSTFIKLDKCPEGPGADVWLGVGNVGSSIKMALMYDALKFKAKKRSRPIFLGASVLCFRRASTGTLRFAGRFKDQFVDGSRGHAPDQRCDPEKPQLCDC